MKSPMWHSAVVFSQSWIRNTSLTVFFVYLYGYIKLCKCFCFDPSRQRLKLNVEWTLVFTPCWKKRYDAKQFLCFPFCTARHITLHALAHTCRFINVSEVLILSAYKIQCTQCQNSLCSSRAYLYFFRFLVNRSCQRLTLGIYKHKVSWNRSSRLGNVSGSGDRIFVGIILVFMHVKSV